MNGLSVDRRVNLGATARDRPVNRNYGETQSRFLLGLLPAIFLLLIVLGPWLIRIWFDVGLLVTIWISALSIIGVVYFMGSRLVISKLERNFLFYSFALALALSLVSLWSPDPVYSIPRAIVSSLFLGFALFLGSRLSIYMLTGPRLFFSIVNRGLIVFFLFLLYGYYFIPEFSSGAGGFRLSGGINPNTVGMYCLYVIIWSMLARAIIGRDVFSNNFLLLLVLIALLLSFSRASWLAVFLLFLFSFLFGCKLEAIKRGAKYAVPVVVIGAVYLLVSGAPDFLAGYLSYFDRRVFVAIEMDSNVLSRASAWNLLMAEFYRSPLVGSFGWYSATKFLSASGIADQASSPHGLYVRLLPEVGLLGFIAVLGLPLSAAFVASLSVLRIRKSKNPIRKREIRIYSVLVGGLVSIFMGRELFEDSYLVSYINGTTLIVAFLVAFIFNMRSLSKRQR